jgi:hypothetical protein
MAVLLILLQGLNSPDSGNSIDVNKWLCSCPGFIHEDSVRWASLEWFITRHPDLSVTSHPSQVRTPYLPLDRLAHPPNTYPHDHIAHELFCYIVVNVIVRYSNCQGKSWPHGAENQICQGTQVLLDLNPSDWVECKIWQTRWKPWPQYS